MLTHQSVGHNWDRQLCKIWTGSKLIFYPFHTLATCYKRHFTLKSHLILVNLYFVTAQFHNKSACFPLEFPTKLQLCTQSLVLYFFWGHSIANVFRFPPDIGPHDYHQPNSLYKNSSASDHAYWSTTASIIAEQRYGSWLIIKQATYFPIFLCSNMI